MQETILGLDVGTTSTKAVLFDLSGAEIATAQQAYRLYTPQPGWAEQNPKDVWQALVEVIRTVIDRAQGHSTGPPVAGQTGVRVLALTLAAQSGSLIPAQADGSPIYPIITWLDGRTEDLVKDWQRQGLEEKVRRTSGWLLHPGLPLATIAWLRRFRPDLFAKAERYLSVNDFLVHRLTGRFCANPSNGAVMQLVEAASGQWSQELCALAGIRPDQLSPIRPAGAVIGPINPEAARLTGLSAGTLVVNGGHDHCCTALAMGMTSAGKILLSCGTAWVITGIMHAPAVDSIPRQMDLNFHVVPERWTVSQSLGGLGAAVEWWLDQCWQTFAPQPPLSRAGLYAALNSSLQETGPGAKGLLFLPPTGGHESPAGVRPGGFIGLRLDHSRADMSRAIMEGATFELRWALDQIRQAGLPVERLWLVGGAAQNPVWPGLIADVTGLPLTLTHYTHWPALGAAILAGVGAGVFETVEAGQVHFEKPAHHLAPVKTLQPLYDERFAAYQGLVQTISRM